MHLTPSPLIRLLASGIIVVALSSQPAFTQASTTRQSTNEADLPITGDTQAVGNAAVQPAQNLGPAVSTWDFVKMLIILACVVGAIYLLFWLLRKGSRKRIQENDLIRVIGSRGLSGSRALHLVEVGRSVYLVGSSDGGVELISEITDKESLDLVRLKAAEETLPGRRGFQQILSEIFRPAKKPFSMSESVGFLKSQRDRLKKM